MTVCGHIGWCGVPVLRLCVCARARVCVRMHVCVRSHACWSNHKSLRSLMVQYTCVYLLKGLQCSAGPIDTMDEDNCCRKKARKIRGTWDSILGQLTVWVSAQDPRLYQLQWFFPACSYLYNSHCQWSCGSTRACVCGTLPTPKCPIHCSAYLY